MSSPQFDPVYQMPDTAVETHWYTYENVKGLKGEAGKKRFGRKGAPSVRFKAGEKLVLADIQGSGTIRRIWATVANRDAKVLRSLKIEMYWDGATTPAVQAPWCDFFCHSMGQMVKFENIFFSSPEARSFNCTIPMPFRKSAKIVLVNESDADNTIYYDIAATLGDRHNDNMLYFHSYWRRENYTKLRQDMTILPRIEGRGRFLGCNLGSHQDPSMATFWWGEGEIKVYLDGDTEYPTLCGTGTEDYIGTGWGQGRYDNLYQGCQFVAKGSKAHGFYRFHVPDPIYFHKDIRVTIQVIGCGSTKHILAKLKENSSLKLMKTGDGSEYYTQEELEKKPGGYALMERTDDYCATAYWYMDKPENGLAPIADAAERAKDLP